LTLIVTHDHGDFDGLAAAVAAAKLYPDSVIFLPEPLHANVRAFVSLHRDLLPFADLKEISAPLERAVVVDTRKKNRLGPARELVAGAAELHLYDHHPPGDDDLEGSAGAVEPVGATTTLLVEAIRSRGLALTALESTLLLLGIYEDTGCLTHSGTSARDAAAAAYLWEQGIKPELIQEYLRSPLTQDQKGLLEKLIEGREYFELRRRRILFSSASLDDYVRGAAVLFQHLQETEGAELSIILVKMNDQIYLAARSAAEDINLVQLLAPLGAAGHPGAVSATFKTGDLAAVKQQLFSLLESFLPPALTAGDVASQPVITVGSDCSAQKVQDLLDEKGISGCPVVDDVRLCGMISRRDLRKILRHNLGHAPVKGFMRRPVVTASPGDSIKEVRRLMVEHNIGRIPLVDQSGTLAGIITRSDILRSLYRLDRKGRAMAAPPEPQPEPPHSSYLHSDDLSPLLRQALPARLQSLLLMIGQRASRAGVEIFLVGGVIRDLLLGHQLPQDLDFVVLPDAIAFARGLERFLGGKLTVFEQFGTASLFLEKGLRLDFVTARKEFYAAPAALPDVVKSSLKNDLYRRDFTINTLACSLLHCTFGKLYDFFGGREDLRQGKIRTLYNLSFVDDPLRILRAVRFEQRFGFSIESHTLSLIRKAVRSRVLDKLSRQRLYHEVGLIYREPDPVAVLRRLDELGVLVQIYPRLAPQASTWQRLYRIGEALAWAEEREWQKQPDPELVYLCGLLYDLDSGSRSAIIRRLQLSSERTEILNLACSAAPRVMAELSGAELSRSEIVNQLYPLPAEVLLFIYTLAEERRVKDYLKLYLDSLQFIRPKLKGGDLKRLGMKPGPLYGVILQELKEAVLDGKVRSYQEELDFVLSYLEEQREEEG